MADEAELASRTRELDQAIRDIRERVRASYPQGVRDGLSLPDLAPVLQARDAALSQVAAIGSLNPRRPGLLNSAIQGIKKLLARALAWHVRGQVEFNRATVAGFDAAIETFNETNRALLELGGRLETTRAALAGDLELTQRYLRHATDAIDAVSAELGQRGLELAALRGEMTAALAGVGQSLDALRAGLTELNGNVRALRGDTDAIQIDMATLHRGHEQTRAYLQSTYDEFTELRTAWQQKGAATDEALLRVENELLRTIADLRAVFEFRLGQTSEEIQRRLWGDMARLREQFEALIHTELRLIRQREAAGPLPQLPAAATPALPALDWAMFAERFRGTEEYVQERQRVYLPLFEKHRAVVDLGCGRGEFLDLMRQIGVPARGIDASAAMVAHCRAKGLEAEAADLFAWLPALPAGSLDGIFCAHVIEHLPPASLPGLLRLAGSKLEPGGVIAIETPNPECLAIFASHFYLDPTHARPVPPALLRFYLEEAGFNGIGMRRFSPAIETMPALASLPPELRDAFFGGLDYALTARRV